MLKIRTETEDWREVVNGWILSAEDDRPEHEVDQLADTLCNGVLRRLNDAGVEYERSSSQSVGAFAIVQSGADSEREAFDAALEAEAEEMRRDLASRPASDRKAWYVVHSGDGSRDPFRVVCAEDEIDAQCSVAGVVRGNEYHKAWTEAGPFDDEAAAELAADKLRDQHIWP